MVLSQQAKRAWKTGTAILTAGTAFHVVFQVDYGDHDHVFTGIQKWYRDTVDYILIGDINNVHPNGPSSPNSSSSASTGIEAATGTKIETKTGYVDAQLDLNVKGNDRKDMDR